MYNIQEIEEKRKARIKREKQESLDFGNFGCGLIIAALIISFGVWSASYDRKIRKIGEESSRLVKKAIESSAGEDRIWSMNEKRKFLDEYGHSDVTLQEGEDIYFRPTYDDPKRVRIFLGYNLENNGGLLFGSSAQSGTFAGEISLK